MKIFAVTWVFAPGHESPRTTHVEAADRYAAVKAVTELHRDPDSELRKELKVIKIVTVQPTEDDHD